MSHVDWKMTRHTLIKKHTDSTHMDSKNQKFKNSKINEKTSMNQVETTGVLVSYAACTLLVSCLRERVL